MELILLHPKELWYVIRRIFTIGFKEISNDQDKMFLIGLLLGLAIGFGFGVAFMLLKIL